MSVIGEAYLELGELSYAMKCFHEVYESEYELDLEIELKVCDKLTRFLYYYGTKPSDGVKICRKTLENITPYIIEFNVDICLIFDPAIRMAQFYRQERKFKKAKEALEFSTYLDRDYLHILRGMLSIGEGQKGFNIIYCMDEFEEVIKKLKNFKDLRSFLNRNKHVFELEPDDRTYFVDTILHLSKDKDRKPVSLDFMKKVEGLRNSYDITTHLMTRLEEKNLIAPIALSEIGGPRFSFHKGKGIGDE